MSEYSLPYVKFIVRHEHELRVHWHSLVSDGRWQAPARQKAK